jgi:formate hydrogenlyase transcriptional activator
MVVSIVEPSELNKPLMSFIKPMNANGQAQTMVSTIPLFGRPRSPYCAVPSLHQLRRNAAEILPSEAQGLEWMLVVHPADIERLLNEWRDILASDQSVELEVRIRRFDGDSRSFLVKAASEPGGPGECVETRRSDEEVECRARTEKNVRNENLVLREEIERSSMFEEIVGSSEPMRRVLKQVIKVAPLDSTVLLLGETGTGKELLARALHLRSARSGRAFIRVNCAAIPQSLIASELFGHEKGAFTGAMQRRIGRFEAADGGTLFLDEIGDLPSETQIALLRVLQEREIERVGSNHSVSVNVRVIAATNRDLRQAVAAGTFRQDLFYRLNVVPIQAPSLRERPLIYRC